MGAVAMLQPQDEPPAVLIVTERRACAVPASPGAGTGAANCSLAHWVGKRKTASGTPWRNKKGDPTPAPAAQRIGLVDRLAAGETTGR